MYTKTVITCRVWDSLWFQKSTGGLETYSPWIGEGQLYRLAGKLNRSNHINSLVHTRLLVCFFKLQTSHLFIGTDTLIG